MPTETQLDSLIQSAKMLGIYPVEVTGHIYLRRDNMWFASSCQEWVPGNSAAPSEQITWAQWKDKVGLELQHAIESCSY